MLHQPVEQELGPGQTDVFTVDVAAGLFLHVEAEKKGVDAVLVLADPEGPEPASHIADRSGAYQVQVTKSPRSSEAASLRR